MYATTLNIDGFKCFGKARMALQYPGRRSKGASEIVNVNVVLGDNGGGKSSVLRALALAALAPVLPQSGFVPYRLVRRAREGEPPVGKCLLKIEALLHPLEVKNTAGLAKGKLELPARIDAARKGNADRLHPEGTPGSPVHRVLEDDHSPAFFIAGYGATRRVETGDFSESSARRSRGARYARVAGLFDDHVTLRPLQAWLPKLQNQTGPDSVSRHEEVKTLLNAVLPKGVRFTGIQDPEDEHYLFEVEGRPTPLASLSDGHKAFVGWIGDLLYHLNAVAPQDIRLDGMPGMVLVDEIDLHLHPRWQLGVVPALARVFPALQFVFTTHSPLVVSSVKRENVFVTDTAGDGTATLKQLDEHVHGRSVEQLLLSSYFGLTSTRPKSFRAQGEDLFRQAAAGDSTAALAYLEKLTAPARR